jgi:uncharacterized protein YjbI with pentapeptide repeats
LQSTNLRGAVLTNAIIHLDSLEKANLDGAMTNAPLGPTVADLPAPLSDMIDWHAIWVTTSGKAGNRLDISGYDVRGVTLFTGADLTLIKAESAIFYGVNLTKTQMQAALLNNADFRHTNAEKMDLRGAELIGARLTHGNFTKANFTAVPLSKGGVIHADLSGANLRYGQFVEANFKDAKMAGADLSYANFMGANLTGVDLTGAKLDGIRCEREQQRIFDEFMYKD